MKYSIGQRVEYRELDSWAGTWPWVPAIVTAVYNEPDHIGDFWVVHIETYHFKKKRLVGPQIKFQLRSTEL